MRAFGFCHFLGVPPNPLLFVLFFFQGCFLIPYFICLIFAGVPILILEVALGQLTSQGGITAWLICPLFQGLYTVV